MAGKDQDSMQIRFLHVEILSAVVGSLNQSNWHVGVSGQHGGYKGITRRVPGVQGDKGI